MFLHFFIDDLQIFRNTVIPEEPMFRPEFPSQSMFFFFVLYSVTIGFFIHLLYTYIIGVNHYINFTKDITVIMF